MFPKLVELSFVFYLSNQQSELISNRCKNLTNCVVLFYDVNESGKPNDEFIDEEELGNKCRFESAT